MAVTSLMVPLGTPAPDFALTDVNGKPVRRDDFAAAPALLVAFLCNHCPYVRHIEGELGKLLAGYPELAVVGICTNDADAYPDDAPARLAEQAARAGWAFPYLVDADQQVGRAYNAACTPDFFLYDRERRLAYRGAFDDSTPGNRKPVTGEHLRAAIDLVLAGKPVPEPHQPSMGCSIKWRE
ncbi:MAG TPA: thioredoxin family protein [Pilimelia sp.]|nr:thioredoxin family protein [Pilimelia sp.]